MSTVLVLFVAKHLHIFFSFKYIFVYV